MTTIKRTIYAVLIAYLAVVSSNFGMENIKNKNISVNVKKTDLELFLEKFAPPKELRDLIEKNKADIKFEYILKGKTTSWICKGNGLKAVSRIINAWRCNKLIEKYNLDCLGVPSKYAYAINGQIWVFAEYIKSAEFSLITLEEAQQLAEFSEKAGFRDWRVEKSCFHNIIRSYFDKKLIIFDSEDQTFNISPFFPMTNFMFHRPLDIENWLETYEDSLRKKYKQCFEERHSKDPEWQNSIINSTEYDDPKIDFEKVKQQLRKDEQQRALIIKSKL